MFDFKVPQKILDTIAFPMLFFAKGNKNETWQTRFIITNNKNGMAEGYVDTKGLDRNRIDGVVMAYRGHCRCPQPKIYNKHILFKYHCVYCGEVLKPE